MAAAVLAVAVVADSSAVDNWVIERAAVRSSGSCGRKTRLFQRDFQKGEADTGSPKVGGEDTAGHNSVVKTPATAVEGEDKLSVKSMSDYMALRIISGVHLLSGGAKDVVSFSRCCRGGQATNVGNMPPVAAAAVCLTHHEIWVVVGRTLCLKIISRCAKRFQQSNGVGVAPLRLPFLRSIEHPILNFFFS